MTTQADHYAKLAELHEKLVEALHVATSYAEDNDLSYDALPDFENVVWMRNRELTWRASSEEDWSGSSC